MIGVVIAKLSKSPVAQKQSNTHRCTIGLGRNLKVSEVPNKSFRLAYPFFIFRSNILRPLSKRDAECGVVGLLGNKPYIVHIADHYCLRWLLKHCSMCTLRL